MPTKKRSPNGSGNISRRKDGRYELKVFVDTPDGRRKRISVYGTTWDEADAERTRVKELQRKAIPVESTTMTVAQYMQYWLSEVARPTVGPTTFHPMSCWCGYTLCRGLASANFGSFRHLTLGRG